MVRHYTPYSKSLERAWSRGIVDRTEEYSFVLSTMPRFHARSRLLELGVFSSSSSSLPLSTSTNLFRYLRFGVQKHLNVTYPSSSSINSISTLFLTKPALKYPS